jgi:hypothetical protein
MWESALTDGLQGVPGNLKGQWRAKGSQSMLESTQGIARWKARKTKEVCRAKARARAKANARAMAKARAKATTKARVRTPLARLPFLGPPALRAGSSLGLVQSHRLPVNLSHRPMLQRIATCSSNIRILAEGGSFVFIWTKGQNFAQKVCLEEQHACLPSKQVAFLGTHLLSNQFT